MFLQPGVLSLPAAQSSETPPDRNWASQVSSFKASSQLAVRTINIDGGGQINQYIKAIHHIVLKSHSS